MALGEGESLKLNEVSVHVWSEVAVGGLGEISSWQLEMGE